MKHWFYTEDEKPKSVGSFNLEQMKQFLAEVGEKIVKVGDEITKEMRLFDYTESLAYTFNQLTELGVDFNKAHLEIGYEEDYESSYEYITVLYATSAKESDVEDSIHRQFNERYHIYQASYDNYLLWKDRLGYYEESK